MAIEWSKKLSTGVKWQDAQHRELLKRINMLLDAMSTGHGKDEVAKLYKFLDEYFVVHFDTEEQAMHRHNYPDAVAHISEHTRFIDAVSVLEKEAEKGIPADLIVRTQREVVNWLVNHIGSIDKRLAEFLKKAEKEK
ncbi:MAG: hemerythrin family protein [Thermodesulfobacteriota bacterium]|nr:MAG: hemerythrin family protein [Thermodesulfobacteriota bacterium]